MAVNSNAKFSGKFSVDFDKLLLISHSVFFTGQPYLLQKIKVE